MRPTAIVLLTLLVVADALVAGLILPSKNNRRLEKLTLQSIRDRLDATGSQTTGLDVLSYLALGGAVETGYLTWSKVSSVPIGFCSGQGQTCNDILNGPFSTIPFLNIPLVSIGLLGYGAVAILAMMSNRSPENIKSREIVLFLSTCMATFSGYLMILLYFVLQSSCNYCYLSAALSASMAAVAYSVGVVPNRTKSFIIALSSMAVTSLSSVFLFYVTSVLTVTESAQASTAPAAQYLAMEAEAGQAATAKRPPTITKPSSEAALKLAERLKAVDAKMYGAYWCSHCFNQKQELGVEAYKYFAYIECDKEGYESQYGLCKSKKIPGYPTWEINGEFYPGEKTIAELDKIVPKLP